MLSSIDTNIILHLKFSTYIETNTDQNRIRNRIRIEIELYGDYHYDYDYTLNWDVIEYILYSVLKSTNQNKRNLIIKQYNIDKLVIDKLIKISRNKAQWTSLYKTKKTLFT